MAQIISLGVSRGEHTQQVPLLDLKRQYTEICDDMGAALRSVSDSGQFVLGPEVKKLEQSLAVYSQVGHAVGCASGSDALLLSLMACGIESGNEVIVPSFTFFATASAVTRLGATPVFADIEPKSFNIDPNHVAQLINEKTKAIIPVNLFGQMAEMKTLNDLTCGRNIALIEDSAQAIGAELENRRTGSWGDMCALSFYPTKNLGGAGDGGMVVTNNAALADKLRLLRGHGMEPRYYHSMIGINSRLDSYQAAVLNVKLPHLDKWTTMRKQNADRYNALFRDAALDGMVVYPETLPNRRHVWNQYVIRVPNGLRDMMRKELAESKIGTEIYYPLGLHEQECFRNLGYAPESLPETFRATREVIALPIYPELTEREQVFVVEKIKQFCKKQHQFTLPKAA
ncbi:MAG: DegT/DnrJ/EryC1/StrS family aminotransferase [Planctomycetaceae bacterium]|jgi:dTDP-4-amino-4,6-dideoxygalactose transaminase|nr:DegT/DnrJ/EryC1/StrS family aminotransferase [Planctomycetaceae bacterium]